VLVAGSVAVALSLPATATNHTGNGQIFIDGAPFENLPGNEPHVGCQFQIEFRNYDKAQNFADVHFELIPPTDEPGNTMTVDGDIRVFIGEDPAGGPDDVDASELYTLSFTGPPSAQGYHVKLTINAEGTQAADIRHKVYYVTECEPTETTEPTPPVPTEIVGGKAAPTAAGTSGEGSANLLPLAGGLAGFGLLVAGMAGMLRRRARNAS